MKLSRKSRGRHLQYETLEDRRVMDGDLAVAYLSGGVLNVIGTDEADNFEFIRTDGRISVDGLVGSWTAKSVKSIVVDLKGGDNFVSLASTANGGNRALGERVTVKSAGGSEQVVLPSMQSVNFSGPSTLAVDAKGAVSMNGVGLNLSGSVVASLKKGVLTVTDANGNNEINFRQSGGKISIEGLSGSWAATKVKSIVVNLQDGENYVSLHSLANGGTQVLSETVTIRSGGGDHAVMLANGNDVSFSGTGHTLVVSAGGTATLDGVLLSWDPPAPDPDLDPDDPNWFDQTIQDAALRTLGSSLYVDGVLDRADMLALFDNVQDNGVVDSTELFDLQAIINNSTLFGLFDYVWKLSSYVVGGNTANAKYQGGALGNLVAGSTEAHLEKLVNKWFLGLDRPTTSATYRAFTGSLFVGGAAYTDIKQGNVGDCYLMASLAEVALRDPNKIASMFIVNGDGTYTARFYNSGVAHYVTVDSYLPTNSSGALVYAGLGLRYDNASGELWVPLAEKAYVQLNEMGFVRPGQGGNGVNSYAAIASGYIFRSLGHITGQGTVAFAMTDTVVSFTTFVNAWNAGKSIAFASYGTTPSGSGVVPGHAYSVVGYNSTNQTVTMYNPWGPAYSQITLNWNQVKASFQYFDRTA